MIEPFNGVTPTIHPTAWVHPTAVVIGRVTLGPKASVWPGCVLRGDIEPIEIGEATNLQDGTICHTSSGFPVKVGKKVVVGHRVTIHSAVVEDESLVGMGATLLDGSRLGTGAILAAGALLAEGKEVPEKSLAVGIPAKVLRTVKPEETKRILEGVEEYLHLVELHKGA